MSPTLNSKTAQGRDSERGSAYLAVLMLLVVLTIVGLSLSVITQTEVFIGGNEKQSTRQLFSAASGVNLAWVHLLVAGDTAPRMTVLQDRDEPALGSQVRIGDRVCTTAVFPLHSGPCNLCAMNQDGAYKAIQLGVTSNALRHSGDELGARREIGGVLAIEPWSGEIEIEALGNASGKSRGEEEEDVGESSPNPLIDPCLNPLVRI